MTQTAPKSTANLVHTMELDINIFDTDCFGVMWHGAYLKWMEIGRVKVLEERGLRLSRPGEPDGYIYPVTEQNLKFRSPGAYGDQLTLTTTLAVEGYKLNYTQVFTSQQTGKTTLESTTTVVILDSEWKLQRRLPESILAALS